MSATSPSVAQPAQSSSGGDRKAPLWVQWVVKLTRPLWNPVVLYRKAPMPIGEVLSPLDADDAERLPAAIRERLATCEHALMAMGFSPPVRGTNTSLANIRSCFSLFEHAKDRSLAFVLVMQGAHVGTSAVVSFRTDFADGTQLYTSNSASIPRMPTRPKVKGTRFTTLKNTSELYDIHRFCVAERAKRSAVVNLTRGPDPLAYQMQEARDAHEFWVRRRYYDVVDGPALRFTVRGAILASWRGLFPWKQLTEWRNARRASGVLARRRRA
jgi:hypothetical protein